jgi:signal transduction histidine kinase
MPMPGCRLAAGESGMKIGPANGSADPRDLIFALAHEIANLLAGARLEAGLLDPGAGAAELQQSADRISETSARAGSLLALLRPLLAPEAVAPLPIDALELLEGLRSGLDESSDARVVIALKTAALVPVVRLAPDSTHHLLLTAVWAGLEAAPGGGTLRVFCRVDGDRVGFVVEDDGPAPDLDPAGDLRGRPLTWAITRAVLASMNGRLFVTRDEPASRTRVALDFPADAG